MAGERPMWPPSTEAVACTRSPAQSCAGVSSGHLRPEPARGSDQRYFHVREETLRLRGVKSPPARGHTASERWNWPTQVGGPVLLVAVLTEVGTADLGAGKPAQSRLHPFLPQDSWARIRLLLPKLHSQLEQDSWSSSKNHGDCLPVHRKDIKWSVRAVSASSLSPARFSEALGAHVPRSCQMERVMGPGWSDTVTVNITQPGERPTRFASCRPPHEGIFDLCLTGNSGPKGGASCHR